MRWNPRQSDLWRTLHRRELQIELDDLIARHLAGIGHRHIGRDGIATFTGASGTLRSL